MNADPDDAMPAFLAPTLPPAKKRSGGKQCKIKRAAQRQRWRKRNREKWNAYMRGYHARRKAREAAVIPQN